MVGRIALVRPLTGERIHPGIEWKTGSDLRALSTPGEVTFTVDPSWYNRKAPDGLPYFMQRGTLVVVERENRTIRQVGLLDTPPRLTADSLELSCGGISMLPGQAGPWEGSQGHYVAMDPLTLFRRIWDQTQSYPNANLGVRVTGATRTGSTMGDPGSARWRQANREYNQIKPELDRWEGRLLARERTLSQRQEVMFRAAGLRRVGTLHRTDDGSNPPGDPGYQADSTLWVRDDGGIRGRAHRWRDGRWVSQSQADEAVRSWRNYLGDVEIAKAEVDRLKYLIEPLQERLEELEDEAREEYSLYFWQDHDLTKVIEDLTEMGPFEYREEAAWQGNRLDLILRVGSPSLGVRRDNLRLELGVNVQDHPILEEGDVYTGVTLFGAGQGSEVLSAQRDLDLEGVVRRILVDTDKNAHTKALTRAAANKRADQVRADMAADFTSLTIYHDEDRCPEGSFQVGDQLPITGRLSNGATMTRWMRVLQAEYEWGSDKTRVEVEPA